MSRFHAQACRFLFLLPVLLLLCSSCVSGRWVQMEVYGEKELMVLLEHRLDDNKIVNPKYAHPYSFDTREITELLLGLHYRSPRIFQDPVIEPVFDRQETARMAPQLAKALATAEPWERIRFVSYNTGGGLLFSTRRKTEGVMFLEDGGQLNVAFVTVNRELEPGNIHDPDTGITRIDPLNIKSAQNPLEPQPWYKTRLDEKTHRPYPLWAVINLDRARELMADSYKKTARQRKQKPAVEQAPVQNKAGNVKKAAPPGPKIGPADTTADPMEESLKRLKGFYEKGLIDEEEYKARRAEILDQLIRESAAE